MPGNKKPRKKYVPKPKMNTLVLVGENIKPVTSHTSYLLDLKLKNSTAMASLLRGQATRREMDLLIAMSNIVTALQHLGFGKEYKEIAVQGRIAIISIAHRAVKVGRFVPTGPEITALNELMELHDAQFDVITVKDLDKAIDYAKAAARSKSATKLPTGYLNTVDTLTKESS